MALSDKLCSKRVGSQSIIRHALPQSNAPILFVGIVQCSAIPPIRKVAFGIHNALQPRPDIDMRSLCYPDSAPTCSATDNPKRIFGES